MHGVQRPISLEYQIYPPANDTLENGMVTASHFQSLQSLSVTVSQRSSLLVPVSHCQSLSVTVTYRQSVFVTASI